jgi:hypothetical protein
MPKRVLDGDAMWGSTKLSELPEWMVPEYSWFYPLADANGSFEITNLRIIWGKVAAIRPHLTLESVQEIMRAFHQHGALFIWDRDGKRYAHWTGSEKPGRLPAPARRTKRYGPILAPAVPASDLREYLARVRSEKLRNAKASASSVLVLGLVLDMEGTRASHATASEPAAPGVCEVPPTAEACVEAETKDVAFSMFWEKWPRRQARADARRAWRKIPMAEYPALMAGLEKWLTSDQWNRRVIPHPATWLNEKRWQDEDIPQFGGINGTHTASSSGKPNASDLALRNARALGLDERLN